MSAEHVKYIEETVQKQRAFFQTGATRPVARRLHALGRLKAELQAREKQLLDALQADLHKSHFEGYLCELGLSLDELGYLMKMTPQWALPSGGPPPCPSMCPRAMSWRSPTGWPSSCPPGITPTS